MEEKAIPMPKVANRESFSVRAVIQVQKAKQSENGRKKCFTKLVRREKTIAGWHCEASAIRRIHNFGERSPIL